MVGRAGVAFAVALLVGLVAMPLNICGTDSREKVTPLPVVVFVDDEPDQPFYKQPKVVITMERTTFAVGEPILVNFTLWNSYPMQNWYAYSLGFNVDVEDAKGHLVDTLWCFYPRIQPVSYDGTFISRSWAIGDDSEWIDCRYMNFSFEIVLDGTYGMNTDDGHVVCENDIVPGEYTIRVARDWLFVKDLMPDCQCIRLVPEVTDNSPAISFA